MQDQLNDNIQGMLTRKFTREVIREALKAMTNAYLKNTKETIEDVLKLAGWFAVFNVPVKFSVEKKRFLVIDQEISKRFIPEDDELLFLELNEAQKELYKTTSVTDVSGLADDNQLKIKMMKIISYLEAQGYTIVRKKDRYDLEGISS